MAEGESRVGDIDLPIGVRVGASEERPGGRPQLPTPPTSTKSFKSGDSNGDGGFDIPDAVFLLGCKFLGNECPRCDDSADANDDGRLDISR